MTLELAEQNLGTVEDRNLREHALVAYLEYAMSVNKGRQIPYANDGLKPVHRRILFAMDNLNLTPMASPAKSARVVGEVIGKYHPHGDTSVYDAALNMARPYYNRYPLVICEGNYGTRDGDTPAAMRYTEMKLSPYASIYTEELSMGTVRYVMNYDGTLTEPKSMPGRLPMLLINGSEGIGVGMASGIPSHNLAEVSRAAIALIRNPKATVDDLMEHIQGPDLPSGSTIISSRDAIKACYETGRGSIICRAKWVFEELARGQWQLVFTELPHETSSAKVATEIEDILDPKPKNNDKELSQRQLQLKKLGNSLIELHRDESGKEHAIRYVIVPQSSKVDRDQLVSFLLVNTSLESGVSFNMVQVDSTGRPRQLNLIETLSEWIGYRFACMTNRTMTRLDWVMDRMHILEGRHLVFLNIDEVVRIIRESDGDPKGDLMARFNLTERQAEDILEMRLRQLAGLEGIKIEQEIEKLKGERVELEALLADDSKMRRQMIKEMEVDIKRFADERRTTIEFAPRASLQVKVADDPVTVILSQKGWIRSRQGHAVDTSSLSFKDGDSLLSVIKCRTVDDVVLMASDGRTFSVTAGDLPGGKSEGVPLTTMIELSNGARILYMLAGKPEDKVYVSQSASYGFICQLKDMVASKRAGKAFMRLDGKEKILPPVMVQPGDAYIAAFATNGKALIFPIEEMKELGGGKGVIIMGMDDKDSMVATITCKPADIIQVSGKAKNGRQSKVSMVVGADAKYQLHRARKGCALGTLASISEVVFAQSEEASGSLI